MSQDIPKKALLAARANYPLLASSVDAAITSVLDGRSARRVDRNFLITAFAWDTASGHERLALLEMCFADFRRSEAIGIGEKLQSVGRADRQTWSSLYSEMVVARALEAATGGRVVAFDPSASGSRVADVLFELEGVEMLIEIFSPRPPKPDAPFLAFSSRLMEALKRVEAGVDLTLWGCEDLDADSELPAIDDAVKAYRRQIAVAAVGETVDLGHGISVKVERRYSDLRAVSIGGGVPSVLIGDGPRLAQQCCEEAKQLDAGRPGLVIADLGSQNAFVVDPWDAGLAEASYTLRASPPTRGEAVLVVRSPGSRASIEDFPRIALWQRAHAPQPLLAALSAGPVERPSLIEERDRRG